MWYADVNSWLNRWDMWCIPVSAYSAHISSFTTPWSRSLRPWVQYVSFKVNLLIRMCGPNLFCSFTIHTSFCLIQAHHPISPVGQLLQVLHYAHVWKTWLLPSSPNPKRSFKNSRNFTLKVGISFVGKKTRNVRRCASSNDPQVNWAMKIDDDPYV